MDFHYSYPAATSPIESSYSMCPSPAASTFSTRSHGRCPSVSSIMTSPDSPTMTSKFTLDDLLEDPSERDDFYSDSIPNYRNEPICICDTTFCEHRQTQLIEPQPRSSFTTDWTMPDDRFIDDRLFGERSHKRRKSGEMSTEGIASRLGRRFPSISRRFSRHQSSASFSGIASPSVSHSRSSSVKMASSQSMVLPTTNDPYGVGVSTISPASSQESHGTFSSPRITADSMDNAEFTSNEYPTDQRELTRTPLLPPLLSESYSFNAGVTSPLQLPSIALPTSMMSAAGQYGMPTPPLSAKPSEASLAQSRPGHGLYPTCDIPPLAISEETDPWANRLGHANFHIIPEPYMPKLCDAQSCKRLVGDWESARREYMRQAARVCDVYGQTSQIYKLTEEKWAGIDSEWRSYHEQANTLAEASGESPLFQPLAETKPLAKIPSLADPQQPSKFLVVDEADIVGPMVQYAKIQHQRQPSASRKSGLFKIFTDPSSLLGGRSSWSPRS